MDFTAYLKDHITRVDQALDRYLPAVTVEPTRLHEAMRYSLFAGGKRLRPILVLAAAEACGGSTEAALPAACAVECLHTYSLVHDDLPSMDNDDYRRGRLTSHKVYGEALAILVGDALQAIAFEILGHTPAPPPIDRAQLMIDLAQAAGSRHLIAGQVLDLQSEGQSVSFDQLRAIHLGKTAALLTCCARLGGMSAGADAASLEALTKFGRDLGLAFQVIDDILDVTQSSETLGKTAGKDLTAGKATYPALLGLEKAKVEAERLTESAHQALSHFGPEAAALRHLADHLLKRDF
jgi:geranylgeranyl diphosphate synthase, type II